MEINGAASRWAEIVSRILQESVLDLLLLIINVCEMDVEIVSWISLFEGKSMNDDNTELFFYVGLGPNELNLREDLVSIGFVSVSVKCCIM